MHLQIDPGLVRERNSEGSTGLHLAVRHPDALRLLIEHGADPHVRDVGDNASPLHLAAGRGHLDSVRVLLDAGADVQGAGDVHQADVIGWAAHEGNEAVVNLLLERGARHHIFSAIALGDLEIVEGLVEEDPECLFRRRSRFENGQTPLHAALAPPDGLSGKDRQYPMLELLIEHGAEVDAKDDKGRTPLMIAMLRGDREGMRLLKAAGAEEPRQAERSSADALGQSIRKLSIGMSAPNLAETVAWYTSIGFKVVTSHEQDGELDYVILSIGAAEIHFNRFGEPASQAPTLWFVTKRITELYDWLKQRQLRVMTEPDRVDEPEVRFEEDLYEPFYGGRQFSIKDNNGTSLIFYDPVQE
ncbi:ankyrin repeat domain-containing protein [Actinopolymorpha sp. B11F2]|uniref:ankyrin repeat domain-containing protein n=1 Tax=Actinopolymorpha sp. B11F2 TaxID=3160862 RepID=UPI0032E40677